jgi:hypothetical protein
MPGERGYVVLVFDPSNRSKVFRKSVRVQTSGKPSEVTLRVRGFILPDPQKLRKKVGELRLNRAEFNFEYILDTETRIDSILILNSGEREMDLVIEDFMEIENVELSISDNPLLPGETAVIYAKVKGDKGGKYGFNRERVKFYDNNNLTVTMGGLIITYNQEEDFGAWTNEEKSRAPQIRFFSTVADFGESSGDEEVISRFRFENTGGSDLHIRDIRMASFVTILDYDAKVSPGNEGEIVLKINLSRSTGDFIRYITVTTNCPTRVKNRLTLQGKVIDR